MANRSGLLWPVGWMDWVSNKPVFALVLTASAFCLSLACLMTPHKRWLRVLMFLLNFQCLALAFSPAKIDHGYHVMLIVSLWLIFIDLGKKQTRASQRNNKFYFQVLQASFLGSYFLSGLWKLRMYIAELAKINLSWKKLNAWKRHLPSDMLKQAVFNPSISMFSIFWPGGLF